MNADPSDLLEELDELHSRLMSLMIEFPEFQDLKVDKADFITAVRQIADLKDHGPALNRLKMGTEGIIFINMLTYNMLQHKKYDNVWKSIKPIHKLAHNLLVI